MNKRCFQIKILRFNGDQLKTGWNEFYLRDTISKLNTSQKIKILSMTVPTIVTDFQSFSDHNHSNITLMKNKMKKKDNHS